VRPAWSEAFEHDRLGAAPSVDLPAAITRAWAFGNGRGDGVRVAVIDSGVDPTHPSVGSVEGWCTIVHDPDSPDEMLVEEVEHTDLYGHGTACAGIIRSLAPGVELYSVRVLGERLTTKAQIFARGLEWAIDNGMQIVNMSLSTSLDAWYGSFHELADRAAFGRTSLVCAMSNEVKASYPSEFSSVFSVAAHPDRDSERFSANPDPPAEWGAPGISIPVAWLDGATITSTGNSFAAPHIAGMLARVLGAHPGLTCWQQKTVLAALATNARSALT
jgi:subtilisin